MNQHHDPRANGAATISPPPTDALRQRLIQRVRQSAAHERQFQTVRRDESVWPILSDGVQTKLLAKTPIATSRLVAMDSGATLPTQSGQTLQEVVLLSGELRVGEQTLRVGDALCTSHDVAHALRAGPDGAKLYLRLSAPTPDLIAPQHFSTLDDDAHWHDFCPGVRIRELWNGAERRSVLVRMCAGAQVNAHRHGLEEECLMLAGEAFIGDTLLRSGEYQLAPPGSRHGAVQTDVGALFYVHGSLDPEAYAS
jgi:quercetin dioxygenase-like cupin family protein